MVTNRWTYNRAKVLRLKSYAYIAVGLDIARSSSSLSLRVSDIGLPTCHAFVAETD